MIGIIGAMRIEVEKLKAQMTNTQIKTFSGIEFISGTLNGKDAVVAQCGVGKVFAAVCAQTMILEYHIDVLINTGVGGTLTAELKQCDMAISTAVVQHDMDTSAIGDPVGMISGINVVEIYADENLVTLAQKTVDELNIRSVRGIIASGDQFVAGDERRKFISDFYHAIACEMEGAAIGQVAYINKIPFVVLRSISDGISDDPNMDYPTFAKIAADISSRVTVGLVKRL